ncbi:Macrolide export protein MacA [Candidatus Entotheonellaceae bacterium PAL068K]
MNQRLWLSGTLILLIVVLTAGGVFFLLKTAPETTARGQEPRRQVAVDVQEVRPRQFTQTVEVYATVSPRRKGTISAQVNGPLSHRGPQTDPGSAVQPGQELARIEATRYQIALEKAQAALEKLRARLAIERNENEERTAIHRIAQQRLDLARSEYERQRSLLQKKLIAEQALEVAESQVELQRSEFERARSELQSRQAHLRSIQADIDAAAAELRGLQEDLADTVIRAPFAGMIGERFVEMGDLVTPGQKLFTVLDLAVVKVMAQVSSDHVYSIRPGTKVAVVRREHPGSIFEGRVTQVHPEADPRNRTFSVEVEVPNQGEFPLLPGMFTRVRIPVLALEQATLVPRDALLEDGQGSYLYVVDPSAQTARRRNVVVGNQGSEEALILSGIVQGDLLVTRGQELLHDGAPIQWDGTRNPPTPRTTPNPEMQ